MFKFLSFLLFLTLIYYLSKGHSQNNLYLFQLLQIHSHQMLKGIKKSKNTQQQQRVIPNVNSSDKIVDQAQQKSYNHQIDEPQFRLFPSNQGKMKENFIIEEQQQNGNQLKIQRENKQNQNYLANMKQKALEILAIFEQGDPFKVQQELYIFAKMQKKYFDKEKQTKTVSNIKQGQIYEAFPTQEQQKKSEPVKGRFQYNFNYEQDEDNQKLKKSLKRSNKSRPIMRSEIIQDYCIYCPDNQQIRLISASNYVYLAFPKRKTFQKYWHFILAPVEHQQTTIGLNQDVLTQMSNYKKCLLQMFDKKGYLVVFFQQFSQDNSHIYIQCLAVPYSKGQDFPFFFKQSLQTVEGNWTTHNSLIKIQKQKGGLQRQIPKKIKYFYIDFSLGYGYAHVIENDKFWKREFVYEVLATALGVQLYEVKTAAQFSDEQLNKKEEDFKKMWDPFDWTKCL